MHNAVADFLEVETGKPGGEDILAHRSLDPRPHAIPELALGGIGCVHGRLFAFLGIEERCCGGRLCRPVPSRARLSHVFSPIPVMCTARKPVHVMFDPPLPDPAYGWTKLRHGAVVGAKFICPGASTGGLHICG